MKFIVIVLFIALCFQDALCSPTPRQTRRSTRTKAERTSSANRTVAKNAIPPSSSSDNELGIVGEKGKVFLNGKFLHNDQDLNDGKFHIDVTKGYVYLNGKLIAKNSNDKSSRQNPKISEENVDKFEMKIKLGANNEDSAPKPDSKEKKPAANNPSDCALTLDGAPLPEGGPSLSEIPILSKDKETPISCENDEIIVGGKVLYKDDDVKRGKIRHRMTKDRCVYINEKLVGRYLEDA